MNIDEVRLKRMQEDEAKFKRIKEEFKEYLFNKFMLNYINKKVASMSEEEIKQKIKVRERDEHVIQQPPSNAVREFLNSIHKDRSHIDPMSNEEVENIIKIYNTDEHIIIIKPEGFDLDIIMEKLSGENVNYRLIKKEENRRAIIEYLFNYENDENVEITEAVGDKIDVELEKLKSKSIIVMTAEEYDDAVRKYKNDKEVKIKKPVGEELEKVKKQLKTKKVSELTEEDDQKYSKRYNPSMLDASNVVAGFEEISLSEPVSNINTASSADISLG